MQRRHFDALAPVCPVCRSRLGRESPLVLASVFRGEGGSVGEGIVRCTEAECLSEYPVLDGVPLLVAGVRSHVAANVLALAARDDLSQEMESLLGDCCGPGSPLDVARQRLSTYAWDHYGDLDPEPPEGSPRPGSAMAVLARGLELAGDLPPGPVLDAGCAVGRTTFDLARLGRPALGVDLDAAMLRLASRVLTAGEVRYPLRRVGLVYDRRCYPARLPGAEAADFWACDAATLPFPPGTFALVVALNLLDCVASPAAVLAALARVLVPGGRAILATPYDWSPAATPVESWLGGHSQRGPEGGAAEPVLRSLLTPGAHPAAVAGLRLLAEEPALPWRARLHARSTVDYRVHLVVAEATGADG